MWPKSLDAMHGSAEMLAKRVGRADRGQVRDPRLRRRRDRAARSRCSTRSQNGTIEAGHTLTSFYFGKNPALAFDAGVAFGLNTRQQYAWMYYGGGLELLREVFKQVQHRAVPGAAMSACRWAAGTARRSRPSRT